MNSKYLEEAEKSHDNENEATSGSSGSFINSQRTQSMQSAQGIKDGKNQSSIHSKVPTDSFPEKWLKEHQPFESHFLWNHYLIKDFYRILFKKKWVMPVVYGDIN